MKRIRRFTLSRLLTLVTISALLLAIWVTPVKCTFELRGTDVRTSANVGDLIDVHIRNDWAHVLVRKAEIVEYVRKGKPSLGSDVDVVTVKTTLFNKIRMSFCDDFAAVCYEQ